MSTTDYRATNNAVNMDLRQGDRKTRRHGETNYELRKACASHIDYDGKNPDYGDEKKAETKTPVRDIIMKRTRMSEHQPLEGRDSARSERNYELRKRKQRIRISEHRE